MEEVFSYVSNRMTEVDRLNFELYMRAHGAIKTALTKLKNLARGGQRISSKAAGGKSAGFNSDDLEAAKALAKFGIDAMKLARTGGAKDRDPGDKDLFDGAPDPWELKKIE